ncbi:MAG: S9 family peptidase [Acidobacteria bacterium]|nr:S9 family peptidase [Acidobacteriota bacterium]
MNRALFCLLSLAVLPAQSTYKRAPENIRRILSSPATPAVSISPAKSHMLLLEPDRYPPIAELAQPMLRLAGSRINPRNNGPRVILAYRAARLVNLTTLAQTPLAVPAGAKLGRANWSPNGASIAFLTYFEDRIGVLLVDAASGRTQPVAGAQINAAFGDAIDWLADSRHLLLQLVPASRGPEPKASAVPGGPDIQETAGKASPAPTYQDLLKSEHDEKLFDYYATSQAALVDTATGKVQTLSKPAIFESLSVSPDGKYVLAQVVRRPYSWVLPAARFPLEIQIWTREGKLLKTLASLPLADRIPLEGVRTGPRSLAWIPARPATLSWWEALDGGNPREKAPYRDRLAASAAPFDSTQEITKLEERRSSASFLSDGRLWVSDYDRRTRRTRQYILGQNGELVELLSRNRDDKYRDPGTPQGTVSGDDRRVIDVAGDQILLAGDGASPSGDHPFLDRFHLGTKQKSRLFQSENGYYETVVGALNPEGTRLITRRESTTEPPNYYLFDKGKRTAITRFTDPAPELRQVTKRLVSYKRADGVSLKFTLYLPPNYKEGTRLPTVVWAYPKDYADADTAGQVSGSQDRFVMPSGASHFFYLLAGYAILDDASLPVVGDSESFNDTYLDQLVAGARAAIEKAVELGVTDPRRVGVGGHSYGGFMTANLLAHSDLFAAGVARSGAYNRTLTPFGFQSERRTLWEKPDTYLRMSPFLSAHKINEPILLIHGQADNNTGTFPIQSERMYTAVRGNGGTVRLVMLPHESHGYAARESVEHTLAEMIEWFDKHVKNRDR